MASAAREQLRIIDPEVIVTSVTPFSRLLASPLARPRFNAAVVGAFGVAALLLTAVGLYAVISAHVRQRDREIAVRVALGAAPADVRRLVLGEATWLAGCGATLGLFGAFAATRVLRTMLFEIDPLDPATLAAAALSLIAVSLAASLLPMHRAAAVDAVAALRN